jgi:hypothetical protein
VNAGSYAVSRNRPTTSVTNKTNHVHLSNPRNLGLESLTTRERSDLCEGTRRRHRHGLALRNRVGLGRDSATDLVANVAAPRIRPRLFIRRFWFDLARCADRLCDWFCVDHATRAQAATPINRPRNLSVQLFQTPWGRTTPSRCSVVFVRQRSSRLRRTPLGSSDCQSGSGCSARSTMRTSTERRRGSSFSPA